MSCAIIIFVLVSELSRVSQEGLDAAIIRDTGLTGSYEIQLVDGTADVSELVANEDVAELFKRLELVIWGEWIDLPPVDPECVSTGQYGEQILRVLRDGAGQTFPLPFGQTGDDDFNWCIDGQPLPGDALFLPSSDEQAVFGARLYLHPAYEKLVLLSTTQPVARGWVVVSGEMIDLDSHIHAALSEAFSPVATQAGIESDSLFTVRRLDRENLEIRQASQGVAVTYGLIGWGVLALGCVSVVSVQVIVARQRAWFYGLAQSMGVGRWRVVCMFVVETSFVLSASLLLSLFVLGMGSSGITAFALDVFGVEAQILSLAAAVRVGVSLTMMLAVSIGAGWIVAHRRDPLESLEAPRD